MTMVEFERPYGLASADKRSTLLHGLNALTGEHAQRCEPYRRMIEAIYGRVRTAGSLDEVPYLPVRVFKHLALKSVPDADILRTLISSGTTSQQLSKVFLDKETAQLQTKALASIVTNFIGKQRLPMLVVDQRDLLTSHTAFNARAAGVLGFSTFGHHHLYLLDENLQIDWTALENYLAQHSKQPILLFGFTFIVWKYLYQASVAAGRSLSLPAGSLLIHGGGWKRLQDQSVDNPTFKRCLREQLGIDRVSNYYGMVEQVGSIFMECEAGHLHTPGFADVMIRDSITLEPLPHGRPGLIQVLSLLPRSYPGHSLLTEDLGAVLGDDDCACGRLGKYFRVNGRLANVEIRGCSDTRQA